ncbi:MAG TPA: 1-deoxy-D-xylulose-5-phosphate reductoisomerase, partial [Pirellulaceae bacterium]|nr:1-deoxy-D-xylulose-5-phosphate reductoisomerase [Pirellulaceae bacterium]
MTARTRNLAILGATGSIGRSTLEVAAAAPDRFRVVGLSANSQTDQLAQHAQRFRPAWVVVTDPAAGARLRREDFPAETELRIGADWLPKSVSGPEVDMVVAAIVGSAGLRGTWAALEAGKPVALANKETLVVGGPLVTQLSARRNAPLLPVDSEHSAVFQLLHAGRREDLRRVVLTASGGPFRRHTREQLEHVSIADALAHPTWNMGRKITVDSATMMNKALEIIEAKWLFSVDPDRIEVVIHPESII